MALGKITVRLTTPEPMQRKPFINNEIQRKPVVNNIPKQMPPVVNNVPKQTPPVFVTPEPPFKQPPVVPELSQVKLPPAFVPNVGADNISVSVIAPTVAEARDFVCSVYYNLLSFVEGSFLSVYTKDSATLSMLTQTKQYIEDVISKPSGTKTQYSPEQPLGNRYMLTVAQSANQRFSSDIHITCGDYSRAGELRGSNIVFVLLNRSECKNEAELANISTVLAGSPVNWVITGFERERVYYCEEPDSPPALSLREKLKNDFSVCFRKEDTVSFAQVYAGAAVEERNNFAPVYTSLSVCREYQPVACGLAFVRALLEFRAKKENIGPVLGKISVSLQEIYVKTNSSWTEVYR